MILAVLLSLVTCIVAFLSFSPVVTVMCVAPFLLIVFFGLSRGASEAQMALASLLAFIPIAAWIGGTLYMLKYMPHTKETEGFAMAMGVGFFLLPVAALVGALLGAKLGAKWDRRHEGGTEGGLSFLRDRSSGSDSST